MPLASGLKTGIAPAGLTCALPRFLLSCCDACSPSLVRAFFLLPLNRSGCCLAASGVLAVDTSMQLEPPNFGLRHSQA